MVSAPWSTWKANIKPAWLICFVWLHPQPLEEAFSQQAEEQVPAQQQPQLSCWRRNNEPVAPADLLQQSCAKVLTSSVVLLCTSLVQKPWWSWKFSPRQCSMPWVSPHPRAKRCALVHDCSRCGAQRFLCQEKYLVCFWLKLWMQTLIPTAWVKSGAMPKGKAGSEPTWQHRNTQRNLFSFLAHLLQEAYLLLPYKL